MVSASFYLSNHGNCDSLGLRNWRIRTEAALVYLIPDGTITEKEITNLEETGAGTEELCRSKYISIQTLNPCLHLFLSKLPSSGQS